MDTKPKTPEVSNEFIRKLLKISSKHDVCEELYWSENLEFFVICNDFFFWGAADAEGILQEDLELLEQCLIDDDISGTLLYCARKRKLRPQGAAYKAFLLEESWPLFDACGPEREIDMLNPKER